MTWMCKRKKSINTNPKKKMGLSKTTQETSQMMMISSSMRRWATSDTSTGALWTWATSDTEMASILIN